MTYTGTHAAWGEIEAALPELVTLPDDVLDAILASVTDDDVAEHLRSQVSRLRQVAYLAGLAAPVEAPRPPRKPIDPIAATRVVIGHLPDDGERDALRHGLNRLHDETLREHRAEQNPTPWHIMRRIMDEAAVQSLTKGWNVAPSNLCDGCHTVRSVNGDCLC